MTLHVQDVHARRPSRLQRARHSLVRLLVVRSARHAPRLRDAAGDVMQSTLFRIAELSRQTTDLHEFYPALHKMVGTLMDATNFYIAEYDRGKDLVSFPYFVDEVDSTPDPYPPGRGLTAYILKTGKPLLATPEVHEELRAAGQVEPMGADCVDWLGAPLKSGERTWGVIVVQTYDERKRYRARDLEILVFVAQHVAAAIEQKRQEAALRESERRYRQMFENNRAVQLLIDPRTGTIFDANIAAAEFYGWSVEQIRTKHIWEINMLGEAASRDLIRDVEEQKRAYLVSRHRLASGEIRDVEVHSAPVDIGGRTILYAIVHDITERKRAEQALSSSEEKYRNIFNFATVGIYQATAEGRLVTANLSLARMLGYDSIEEL